MKEKLKRFFIEKKELLLFIGVLLVVFTTVIVVANYALAGEKPVDTDPDDQDKPSVIVPGDDDDNNNNQVGNEEEPKVYTISLPITGEYVIVRTFFDLDSTVEELNKAVINAGSYFIESQGISYAKNDNSIFDVYNILPGKVINVQSDALEGTVITIEHDNDVVSIYHSLSEANVRIGDELAENTVIGKAGTSILDNEAGVHVHLEIMASTEYVNPDKAMGKQASEVNSSK